MINKKLPATKKTHIRIFLLSIMLLSNFIYGQYTLTGFVGARSPAMGGSGYATANDGTVLFYNPAILGFSNTAWCSGELQWFREPIVIDVECDIRLVKFIP